MKLSLYAIEAEYLQLAEILKDNGGELTEELEHALSINKENLTTKATNYAFVIKDMQHESDILDAEIERLQGMKKVRDNSVERLKFAIDNAMKLYGVEEILLPNLKINFRKSTSVKITDETKLPKKFIKKTATEAVDKKSILEALKSGEKVRGAELSPNKKLQIK